MALKIDQLMHVHSTSHLNEVLIYLCPSGGHCVAGVPPVVASGVFPPQVTGETALCRRVSLRRRLRTRRGFVCVAANSIRLVSIRFFET